MIGDKKKIRKFFELLPDEIMENIFYTMSDKFITHSDIDFFDKYIDYRDRHDLDFDDTKINKEYKLFSDSMKKLRSLTMQYFYYDGIHKNIYVFYDYRHNHEKEYKELYLERENKLDSCLSDCEEKYRNLRKSIEHYILGTDEDIQNKEKVSKIKHVCEIREDDNKIFIDGNFSGVTLTNSLSRILKKLIKLNKDGNYPLIKTKDFIKSFGDDSFRTALGRLRKKIDGLFEIKNIKNEDGEGCYCLNFYD